MLFRSPTDRLALFIDGANLYSAAKALGFDIDYRKLLEDVTLHPAPVPVIGNGDIRTVDIYTAPIDLDGEVCTLAVVNDVTDLVDNVLGAGTGFVLGMLLLPVLKPWRGRVTKVHG